MRVGVLGGTRFIGVAVVEELAAHGHEVTVIHRGRRERDDAPEVPHAHVDRHDRDALRAALDRHRTEVVVDTCAYSQVDADDAAAALGDRPAVVLSSMDVYRAFAAVRAGAAATDMIPLDESSPVRDAGQRYLFRGEPLHLGDVDTAAYENLDVEAVALARGDTVLRLPMVYGERDAMRREEFVLGRVRAGRTAIPVGSGTFVWTRGWVRDVAVAVRLAAETGAGAGMALNIGERRSPTMAQWARDILAAAGSDAELVRVPDSTLPPDLALLGTVHQPLLVDAGRARSVLGWSDSDPALALERSVRWHLDHPPPQVPDTTADDRALAAA